jgi:CDP-diacylglycerol--glycerol-3-phosphate 3-phosphatidyltransferase
MSDTPHGLLPSAFENWFVSLVRSISNFLARLGVTPDLMTAVSFMLGAITGVLIALSHLHWALLSGFLMGICDIIDGQIASIIQKKTRFGGILDSAVDRYTDFMVLCGLGVYFYTLNQPVWVFIAALTLIGCIEVSYVKARGEGAGLQCNIGFVQRSERLLILGLGLLFGGIFLKIALLLLAVFSHITAAQRLIFLRKLSSAETSRLIRDPGGSPKPAADQNNNSSQTSGL